MTTFTHSPRRTGEHGGVELYSGLRRRRAKGEFCILLVRYAVLTIRVHRDGGNILVAIVAGVKNVLPLRTSASATIVVTTVPSKKTQTCACFVCLYLNVGVIKGCFV